MKQLFSISFLACLFAFSNIQSDTWKVYFNKQLLVSASDENQTKNIASISRSDLDKTGELIVNYEEGNPNNEWKRTIAIVDENNNSLFEKSEINKIQVSNSDLKKMVGDNKKILIYTWAIPKDPAKAALIRVRRVHLCTILLK